MKTDPDKTPKRDPNTGRFLPRNRWHSPKSIASPDFKYGLGMSPNDNPLESYVMIEIAEAYNFKNRAKGKKKPSIKAMIKASLDFNNPPNSLIPDVSFVKISSMKPFVYQTLVTIEIDDEGGAKDMRKKSRDMVKGHGVLEAFFYNMDTEVFEKFTMEGQDKANPSYSDLLGLDLNELLP